MTVPPLPRHPFRFTVQCHGPPDRQGWIDQCRRAEDLGYAMITVPDHLDDELGPVAALMAAADATTTIGLGALVFCNDFRHPVVLAKEAATLDLLSDGRLTLGLGAGWKADEYGRAGLRLDPAGTRIDRLTEAVQIVKGCLADGRCTVEGTHYTVTGLDGIPEPRQRPHPPILIGGGGRRILTLAGREADIVGLNIDLRSGVIDETSGPTATDEATLEKIRWIRDAAGDRFSGIELQVRIHLAMVHEDRDAIADAFAAGLGLTAEQAKRSPHALVGSISELIDQCEERRDRFGISMIGLSADVMDDLAPLVRHLAGR